MSEFNKDLGGERERERKKQIEDKKWTEIKYNGHAKKKNQILRIILTIIFYLDYKKIGFWQ